MNVSPRLEPPTIPVPPACPDEHRAWLLCTLAFTSQRKREAEDVLNVLDGRAPALTERARVWLEAVARETTRRGGWARELLAVCRPSKPAERRAS